ncbi:MAG: hypothetical protein JNK32_00620 [Anaerolineales bacterium]|nr:hypothetical protein [Anaerolineales bacterium]
MNRRDFLKVGGLLSAALLLQLSPLGQTAYLPVEAQTGGKLYRGTSDGRVLISSDAGKSWQLHSNFGSMIDILGLTVDLQGQLFAQLGFKGHHFELVLAQNGTNTWRTA